MASALPSGPPPFPVARFSVEQYHRMIESGAFTEDDQLELIEGWVVRKMAKGPAHEYSVGRCEELLREGAPGLHFYTLNKARSATEVLRNLALHAVRV